MLKDQVIKLMDQHTRALVISEPLEKIRVVRHFKIAILVDSYASGRDGLVDLLLDTT